MATKKGDVALFNALDSLQHPRSCNIVTAAFENAIPEMYKVKIIAVGANFDFEDSDGVTDVETVGPYTVSVSSGGDYVLMSSCREECCTRMFGALTLLHEPSGQTQNLGEFRYPSEGSCLLVSRFVLEIQEESTREDLNIPTGPFPRMKLSVA